MKLFFINITLWGLFAVGLFFPSPTSAAACSTDLDCRHGDDICVNTGAGNECQQFRCYGFSCPGGRQCIGEYCQPLLGGGGEPAFGPGTRHRGEQCYYTQDCEGSLACAVGGVCGDCSSDNECGGSAVKGSCSAQNRLCLQVAAQCGSNANCQAGSRCEGGTCVAMCRSDAQCGEGKVCNTDTGVCSEKFPFTPAKPRLQIPIPGVQFSNLEFRTDESGAKRLDVPFIAEYVTGVYKFLSGIVGVLAVVMLIWGGIQWMLGGAVETASKAKETIRNALIGLVLVLSSYVILNTMNPELVRFKPIGISLLERDEAVFHDAPLSPEELAVSGIRPNWICRSAEECKPLCDQLDLGQTPSQVLQDECPHLPPLLGDEVDERVRDMGHDADRNYKHPVRMDEESGIVISPEVFSARLKPGVIEKLKEVSRAAKAEGYGGILVNSGCRSKKDQLIAICTVLKNPERARQEAGTIVGWPGGSFHGTGQAVDVLLLDSRGRPITDNTGLRRISELFFAHGWVRYCKETWHFELGTDGQYCRSNDINACGTEAVCPEVRARRGG